MKSELETLANHSLEEALKNIEHLIQPPKHKKTLKFKKTVLILIKENK